ncbi:MAG TPA: hypothetical protein VFL14_13930 [Xanthomonadales bacterium]|nr:hypothetical protein [Xanthomonadales bacterium]
MNATGREPRIELRLRELNQLFDSFDPAPFHEKDLDHDAEEFIVSWAREYPLGAPLVFRLHLPRDQERFDPQATVQKAIANYFAYRADLARLAVRRTLQLGRSSAVIGVLFLTACTVARALLQGIREDGWLGVVEEGLLIVGWVAMWRPIELLLYDWRPEMRQKRTYESLSRMRVEVVFTDAQSA